MKVIAPPESVAYLEKLPSESCQHIFWQQQVQAASMPYPRGMCWHPLMIRWCLYLRHKYVVTTHASITLWMMQNFYQVRCGI